MKGQKAQKRIMSREEVQSTHHSLSPSGVCGRGVPSLRSFLVDLLDSSGKVVEEESSEILSLTFMG